MESFIALYVTKTASGDMMAMASQWPIHIGHEPCLDMRKAELSRM